MTGRRIARRAKAVEPGTDMPNLGISPAEARNITAYLEGIR